MINRLNQINMNSNEEHDPINIQDPTKEGTEIASKLVLLLTKEMSEKELSSFQLMQALVEFVVSTVRGLETTGKMPKHFRKILMRNIELNFDYKDAKDQGIDISEMLLMGIEHEFGDIEGG